MDDGWKGGSDPQAYVDSLKTDNAESERAAILRGRDAVLKFMHEHNNWPSPERVINGGFDECLDEAESLAMHIIRAVHHTTKETSRAE